MSKMLKTSAVIRERNSGCCEKCAFSAHLRLVGELESEIADRRLDSATRKVVEKYTSISIFKEYLETRFMSSSRVSFYNLRDLVSLSTKSLLWLAQN